jgi:hypothetical protein
MLSAGEQHPVDLHPLLMIALQPRGLAPTPQFPKYIVCDPIGWAAWSWHAGEGSVFI